MQPRRWPLRTALSIVAGSPVSIQSPARNSPRTGVAVAGRAGWPGASENVARGSRIDRRAHERRAARRPAAPRAARRARSAISSLVRRADERARRRSTRATGATPSLAEHRALVEHPLHRAAGQPTNGSSMTGAIEPQVDGDDRRRRHAPARAIERRLERRRRRRRTARASANHGTAEITAPAGQRLAAGVDRATAPSWHATPSPARRCAPRRRALRCTRAPARRTSGAAAWSAARSPRRADRRRTSPRARARRAAPPPDRGGWLSAASASGSHSISRRRAVWPLRISQFSTVSPGDAAIARRAGRQLARRAFAAAPPSAATDSRSRQTSASQSSTPASRCSGARQRRDTSSRDRRPARSIIVTPSCGCRRTLSIGADLAQKRERLGVAAEQHVLAVVDELAGLAIGERRRAAAEPAARLEHEHARAVARRAATAALRPAKPAPTTTTS